MRSGVSLAEIVSSWRSHETFSASEKDALWSRIADGMGQTYNYTQRTSSVSLWRRLVSGGLIASVFAVVFGVYFLRSDRTIYDNGSAVVVRDGSIAPRVRASSIGRIVSTDGDYMIENGSSRYRTNTLHDGDRIILSNGSRLSFEVAGHQAYVVGPGSVVIHVEGDGYRFVIHEGEFLEVFSSRTDDGTVLTLEVDDMVMAHDAHTSTMQIQLTRDDAQSVMIKNYADEVVVASADERIQTTIQKDEELTVVDRDIEKAVAASFDVSDVVFFVQADAEVVNVATGLVHTGSQASSGPRSIANNLPDVASPVAGVATTSPVMDGDQLAVARSVEDVSSTVVHTGSVSPVSSSSTITADKLLPSPVLLRSLKQLASGSWDDSAGFAVAWGQFVSVVGCTGGSSFAEVRVCVDYIMDTYLVPPSYEGYLDSILDRVIRMENNNTSDVDMLDDVSIGSGDVSLSEDVSGSIVTGAVSEIMTQTGMVSDEVL